VWVNFLFLAAGAELNLKLSVKAKAMPYVYLLHFQRPISSKHTTQHYLGTTTDLDERLWQHQRGKGARLTQVALERQIPFRVAEVWQGGYALEHQLKRQKNHRKFCPLCQNCN
jgi:predicted GIY-YIG superfamily endonuclease